MNGLMKVLCAFAILGGVFEAHHLLETRRIKNSSYVFVLDAVTDIGNSWSQPTFQKYAGQSLKDNKNIVATFSRYSELGKLNGRPDCDLKDYASYKYQNTALIYTAVNYTCTANFDKGAGNIQLTIYRFSVQGEWKIQYFNIDSPYFWNASRNK